MAKARTAYLCSACGAHSVKWAGQCPECGAWNTLSETALAASRTPSGPAAVATPLGALAADVEARHSTGFDEFDRVLGGGLVPGAVTLLGGDPGVGKSTLLQQVSARLMRSLGVCYATGEESLRQIGQRSLRLGLDASAMNLLADTSLENVLAQARGSDAQVLIIDSIQTMTCQEVPSAPGSVTQLREGVGRIVQFAKQNEVSVFIIGHVTKEGAIAGPRVVEHMVDTVLYFESDPASRYTMIRSVKNRFGASGEMGVFAMTESGFREVSNPSAIFLSRESIDEPGSIVSVTWEGSRPLLVEIQALVADSGSNYPKRLAQGVDQNRLALLLAVLQKHGGLAIDSSTSSSMAAPASARPRSTCRSCCRSCRVSAIVQHRIDSSVSARLAWPEKYGPSSSVRNASPRPPSRGSRKPSCRPAMCRSAPRTGSRWPACAG